jgi:hypothetical protein
MSFQVTNGKCVDGAAKNAESTVAASESVNFSGQEQSMLTAKVDESCDVINDDNHLSETINLKGFLEKNLTVFDSISTTRGIRGVSIVPNIAFNFESLTFDSMNANSRSWSYLVSMLATSRMVKADTKTMSPVCKSDVIAL